VGLIHSLQQDRSMNPNMYFIPAFYDIIQLPVAAIVSIVKIFIIPKKDGSK
jgi:hypothetical protein